VLVLREVLSLLCSSRPVLRFLIQITPGRVASGRRGLRTVRQRTLGSGLQPRRRWSRRQRTKSRLPIRNRNKEIVGNLRRSPFFMIESPYDLSTFVLAPTRECLRRNLW